ncbi:hypothetical protein MNEG_7569, partial [Monoraphidium neglectum]
MFAGSHVISVMFHVITFRMTRTGVMMDIEKFRPWWLCPSMHKLNLVVAWADLLLSDRRSFTARSELISKLLVITYLAYINLCRYVNG